MRGSLRGAGLTRSALDLSPEMAAYSRELVKQERLAVEIIEGGYAVVSEREEV